MFSVLFEKWCPYWQPMVTHHWPSVDHRWRQFWIISQYFHRLSHWIVNYGKLFHYGIRLYKISKIDFCTQEVLQQLKLFWHRVYTSQSRCRQCCRTNLAKAKQTNYKSWKRRGKCWIVNRINTGSRHDFCNILYTTWTFFPLVVHPWPPQNVSWPPRWPPVGLRWEVRWPPVGYPGLSAQVIT